MWRSLSGGESVDSPCTIDRDTYEAFGKHLKVMESVYRHSPSSAQLSPSLRELMEINCRLEQAQKESYQYIEMHSYLLHKIDQHENDFFHKIFTPNRQHKLAMLKARLVEKFTEACQFEEEREMLRNESVRLSLRCMSESPVCNRSTYLSTLEIERKTSIDMVLKTLPRPPHLERLESQLLAYKAERSASKAIRLQTEELSAMYRQAMQLLRMALASMLSCDYQQTVSEFVQGPMPLAVEASRLIGVAAMMIQPEAKRRYPKFAPALSKVKLPHFRNFAKSRDVNIIVNQCLDTPQALDRLKENEAIIVQLQKISAFCLKSVQKWLSCVDQDCAHAEAHCARLEVHLDKLKESIVETLSAT